MAEGEEKSGDFYAVLGLKKECSDAELRNAYRKLAMRWHPDKCAASGNAQCVEEAKEKFQEIQEAYSVLSDSNKRFLYDVGVYDSDDDENEGMGEFLGEMAQMMSQTKPTENGQESFEDLQQLFVEMFQADLFRGAHPPAPAAASTSFNGAANANGGGGNKRRSAAMSGSGKAKLGELDPGAAGEFCFGANDSGQSSTGRGGCNNNKRRNGRKQKVSSKHDVSSCDAGIST